MVKEKICLDDTCTQYVLTEDNDIEVRPRGRCDPTKAPVADSEEFKNKFRSMCNEMLGSGGKFRVVFSSEAEVETRLQSDITKKKKSKGREQ